MRRRGRARVRARAKRAVLIRKRERLLKDIRGRDEIALGEERRARLRRAAASSDTIRTLSAAFRKLSAASRAVAIPPRMKSAAQRP